MGYGGDNEEKTSRRHRKKGGKRGEQRGRGLQVEGSSAWKITLRGAPRHRRHRSVPRPRPRDSAGNSQAPNEVPRCRQPLRHPKVGLWQIGTDSRHARSQEVTICHLACISLTQSLSVRCQWGLKAPSLPALTLLQSNLNSCRAQCTSYQGQ